MKRDMDLIRKILLAMEAEKHGYAPEELKVEGYTDEQIGFHVMLLAQADFVNATDMTHNECASPYYRAICLTWDGYEFLEAAKDDTLWNRAKGAGNAALAVLKPILIALAIEAAKQKAGLSR